MPKPAKYEFVRRQHFGWRLSTRNGTYYADGRSNPTKLGRYSLGCTTREEAMRQLGELDRVMGERRGLAVPTGAATVAASLSLVEGCELFTASLQRPAASRGVTAATRKRYHAVIDKFRQFAKETGVESWNAVTHHTINAYGSWLEAKGYEYATVHLEMSTIKQINRFLIKERRLPESLRIHMELSKPQGTTTYCYSRAEVDAMLERCRTECGLEWMGQIITALVHTGVRIGELIGLRWTDVDMDQGMINLVDESRSGTLEDRKSARTTKSHKGRVIPIHPNLALVLKRLPHHRDGRVFHGPRGGVLKSDLIRTALIRDVLKPLAGQFPATAGKRGILAGRLHSFRHFFCSVAAHESVPLHILQRWLGHADSKMVSHYFTLNDAAAKQRMDALAFTTNLAPAV